MKIESRIDGEVSVALAYGILVYQGGHSDEAKCFATLHDILTPEGTDTPTLGAGQPLSIDALADLARKLSGQKQRREILPAHILFADSSRVLWYRPASRRPIFFHTGEKAFDRDLNGKTVLYPPLLFQSIPGKLAVWALASDERPTEDTPLCRAPFLNIFAQGAMCAGTAKLPVEVGTDVRPFERAFFETTFTHSNIDRRELTAYPGGHDALWRALRDPKVKPDWPAWLKPYPASSKNGKQSRALRLGEVLNG